MILGGRNQKEGAKGALFIRRSFFRFSLNVLFLPLFICLRTYSSLHPCLQYPSALLGWLNGWLVETYVYKPIVNLKTVVSAPNTNQSIRVKGFVNRGGL
jgi:hypothetical protein